jgi:hypothetical protein
LKEVKKKEFIEEKAQLFLNWSYHLPIGATMPEGFGKNIGDRLFLFQEGFHWLKIII